MSNSKQNMIQKILGNINFVIQDKRKELYLKGAIFVVVLAPAMDLIMNPRSHSMTSMASIAYLIFILMSLWAGIKRFADEKGNLNFESIKRIQNRIRLNIEISKEINAELKNKGNAEKLFLWGLTAGKASILFLAIEVIISIYTNFMEENTVLQMRGLNFVEIIIVPAGYLLFLLSLALLFASFYKGFPVFQHLFDKGERAHLINLSLLNDNVINLKDKSKVNEIINKNNDPFFRNTMESLLKYQPKKFAREPEFEDDILAHLKRTLRKHKMSVENQYSVKNPVGNSTLSIDLCINDSLFIELKNNVSKKKNERDRMKGQIQGYQGILDNENIPLILLILDENPDLVYNHINQEIERYNKGSRQKILAVIIPQNT